MHTSDSALPSCSTLHAILQEPSNTNAFCLLQQLHARLEISADAQELPLAWQTWWDLMRFCLGTQSIADWLRLEPDALQHIHALLAVSQETSLAAIVGDALQGQAQDPLQLRFSQLGKEDIAHTLCSEPEQYFLGQDWSSTDAAVALHSTGFANLIASLIRSESETLASSFPCTTGMAHMPMATQEPLAALHQLLGHALEVDTLAARSLDAPAQHALLPMVHRAGPPMPADWLEFQSALWHGTPQADVLAAYTQHDGAELFCHGSTVGLHLLPSQQWQTAQQRMLAWALAHTWRDAASDIPAWLSTAICFAHNGNSHEFWIVATQGPLQGKVLLSETDAFSSHARFASIHSFFDTLQAAPQRILNATGQVSYLLYGHLFEPIGLPVPTSQ